MRPSLRLFSSLLFIVLLSAALAEAKEAAPKAKRGIPAAATARVEYKRDIEPLLEKNCYSCHGADKQKSDFRLDIRKRAFAGGLMGADAIVPGDGLSSRLLRFVSGVEETVMPPRGERLSRDEVSVVRAWIEQGATWPEDAGVEEKPDPKRWAFQPLKRPLLPRVEDPTWPRNAIDLFIAAQLEASGLTPSVESDRLRLIRRLKLDVVGLPPSMAEVDAYLSDRSPRAYEKLVDRYLASPGYGERWARHWLDVVRFAESTGFETNSPRANAWPYRDYVIAAFNSDKPYDRFVQEQLAGDALGESIATAFLVAGPKDQVGSPDIVLTRNQRANELHDMVTTLGGAFLGLSVGCARCHNHKFDPIAQKEYYALVGIFAGVKHGEGEWPREDQAERLVQAKGLERDMDALDEEIQGFWPSLPNTENKDGRNALPRMAVNARGNLEGFAPIKPRRLRLTVLETVDGKEPAIDEIEIFDSGYAMRNVVSLVSSNRVASSGELDPTLKRTTVADGVYGPGNGWVSSEKGGGWIELRLDEKTPVDRMIWSRDRTGQKTDRLPLRYVIEAQFEKKGPYTVVVSSEDRPSKARNARAESERLERCLSLMKERLALGEHHSQLSRKRMAYVGQFIEPPVTHMLHRGDPMQPRDPVSPGALARLGERLELDEKASNSERRLALARWLTRGDNPVTARVAVNRLWQHHFGSGLVKTPNDFGANGIPPSHPELLDWLALELIKREWSLKQIHRLVLLSSTYRQSSAPCEDCLAVDAGARLLWRYPPRRLDAEPLRDSILSLSGVLDLRMGGPGYTVFEPNKNYVRVYDPKKQFGPAEYRRMIYQQKPRMEQDATFGVFDCPDGALSSPARPSSITPLQALNLMNSGFMLQQVDLLAARLEREAGPGRENHIRRVFELAYNRQPDDAELKTALEFSAKNLKVLCRAVLNSSELLFMN